MGDIYINAIDSLRISIDYFLKESGYSSRKHAILTLFHAIELFLKEQLHRTNPILIYQDIDKKITEYSRTVTIKEALTRLENLGSGLPKDQKEIIDRIQKRRNRIEHHRYDHKLEDDVTIAESLSFILYFVEFALKGNLESDIPAETLREIQRIVRDRQERYWVAMHRLEEWMQGIWPQWNREEDDTPKEFQGTQDCPICRESFLVIEQLYKPFCFHCNTTVDAGVCEHCGRSFLMSEGCSCGVTCD